MKENLRILKVLMWKHMVVRRRKYINTTIELILTCSLFVLLYLLDIYVVRPIIMDMPSTTQATTTVRKSAVELDSLVAPERIFYTPDNNLTWSLMSLVGKNLKLKRLKKFPGPTHQGFLAIKNESDLGNFFNNLTFFDALVIFNGMDNETLPQRLNYTIRVKSNNYLTGTYEPQSMNEFPNVVVDTDNEVAKHHELFGTIYEPFLRLQWAVDSSYLQMKTGRAIPKKIFLREMPYIESLQGNLLVKAVMIALAMLTALIALEVTFMNIITRTCTERTAGVQELMKISGASTAMIYLSHYLNSLVMGIPFAIIATIFLSIGENPIVADMSPILLFITLVLYFLSVMAFGLAVGGALNSADHAVSVSLTVYGTSLVIALVVSSVNVFNTFFQFLIGLLPHLPLVRFFSMSPTFGNSNFSWLDSGEIYGSLLLVYVCLIVQTLLFFFIAWYLYNVHPGRYGMALPWNYLFMKDYWVRRKLTDEDLLELQETAASRDPRYFEPMRPDEQVGIRIVNLSKIYRSLGKQPTQALSNVTIDVCKNGITVLLGHNGAGKTTLLDIITGMQSATSGEVFVNGHHFVWERAAIRKQLGYCPQHNLLFADLNVAEHLIFFSMLRGESMRGARADAKRILEDMNLVERANAVPSALSGGMARRLQMGCALAGHTTVLLLDEPTSSLDVKSRRALWDVLMGLRARSTVLVSTHFLEEADALGARVVAVRRGALTCDASPLHLKRSIGEGYYLTIGGGNAKLAPTILDVLPNAHLHRMTPTSVTYSLPHSETSKLPQLFVQLEARRTELGINSMGVSAPSLDEVFLKLCYDGVITDSYDEVDRRDFFLDTRAKYTGIRLWWRQFIVLFKRQLLFMWRMKIMMFFYILFPIALVVIIIYATNDSYGVGTRSGRSGPRSAASGDSKSRSSVVLNPARDLSLLIYKKLPHVKVMYNIDDSYDQRLEDNVTENVKFVTSDNVFEEALRLLNEDEKNYERNLMGIEVNDTSAQILYSTVYRHIAPVALNLLSNLIARENLTDAEDKSVRTVTTFNHPMTTEYGSFILRATPVQPKSMMNVKLLATRLALVLICSLFFVSTLLKKEHESGARSNYLRAGVSSTLYWCGTLLMHMLFFILIFLPAYVVAIAFLDEDNTLTTKEFLFTMVIILLVSAAATLTFHYFLHVALNQLFTVVYSILLIFYMLFVIPFIVQKRAEAIGNPNVERSLILLFLEAFVYIFPFNHVGLAISMAAYTAQLNAYCRLNRPMCPAIPAAEKGFDAKDCCSSSDEYLGYYSSFEMSPCNEVIMLIVMTIVYMSLVVAASQGALGRWWQALWASRYRGRVAPAANEDEAVAAERLYVSDQINNVKKDGTSDALLMSDLHKEYFNLFANNVVALQGVSLSVRQGECFGILGVNGAGKTTAFKAIAGEVAPTRGELYVNGFSLKKQREKYLNCVSYCQQYGGVDGFMTGRQCLETLLTVSGYKPELVKSEAKAWLECVDLSRYANKRVESYSGGCLRRVAAAAALCGARPLVLLDEPSSGVDTVARHRLWRAVTRSLGYSAVVLTSHSMDEMEALCARMALVRGGRVLALGDAHALRHAHAHGHALVLRLSHGASPNREDLVINLKEEVELKFDCTLKQEHSNQLDFHINQTMSYSEIFTKLEALKSAHYAILDDYCVNETTLEEVFLAFAEGVEAGIKKNV